MVFTFKRSQSTNQLDGWFKLLVPSASRGPFRNLNLNVEFSLFARPLSEGSKIYRIAFEGKKGVPEGPFALLDERVLMAHHVKNPGRWPHSGAGPNSINFTIATKPGSANPAVYTTYILNVLFENKKIFCSYFVNTIQLKIS